ncbi:hypothetical protein [Oscillatoria sp. HE19RPO]|uniref:hypothetical protein n=1 Tax=Oscillatoria sp. HE19RPO TaxID=2954806 RepID=UPI0020C4B83A|nr:hypothetical protein [Oscillatoria sp. HE19RPO]
MNQPPEKTDCLVDFLRQHRPDIPPASPQLEARILASIAGDRARTRRYSPRLLWLIVPSIAASLSLAFWGIKPGIFSPEPVSDLAQIEAFMEYTWNGLLHDEMLESSNDWLLVEEENISRSDRD